MMKAAYLNKIKSNLNEGKSPADKLLQKYNGTWNKSLINPFIQN